MNVSRERRALVVAGLLVAEGIVSVRVGFAPFEVRQAVLVLLTGWIVGAAGLLAWVRAPSSHTGPILVVVSATWYLASLQGTSISFLDSVGDLLGLAYAAAVVQAVLTFPTGRLRGIVTTIAVGAAYVLSLVTPPLGAVLVATTLALGLALGLLAGERPGSNVDRPARATGLFFALVLGAAAVIPWLPTRGAALDTHPALEIALAIVAIFLSTALVNASDRRLRVTDLVVDLGREGGGGLARELAAAVGDPTLEVGYWLAEQGRYVDATGREVVVPAARSGRGMTLIERAGRPVALLTHDLETSADPGVRSAIARAAELSAANARLQAEVRTQLVEVDASRRRLLDAADEERRQIRTHLNEDLGPLLADLDAALAEAGPGLDEEDSTDSAIEELRETRREMAELAEGLHPRALEERGLARALQDLATRSPTPVDVQICDPIDGPLANQAALYFVCSEAMTNAVKHSAATLITVRLRRSGDNLEIAIEDDGEGGADIRRGTGLQGLRDRVEAHGGSLSISSRAGHGTSLVARVPAGHGSAPSPGGEGAGRGQGRIT